MVQTQKGTGIPSFCKIDSVPSIKSTSCRQRGDSGHVWRGNIQPIRKASCVQASCLFRLFTPICFSCQLIFWVISRLTRTFP